jgi:hypothetical protein
MAWVRFLLARLGLGQEQGSYRKCGHFFFAAAGEKEDEMRHLAVNVVGVVC